MNADAPRVARGLWIAAIATHLMDSAMTWLFVDVLELTFEAAPVAAMLHRQVLALALPAALELVLLAAMYLSTKIVPLSVAWLTYRHFPSVGDVGPDPYRLAIPAVVLVLGLRVVAINVVVDLRALGLL